MTEEIILQSDPKKQDKNLISEKIFYNVSDSDLKILRVRLWIKFFTTCQILHLKTYNVSVSELNFSQRVSFWNNIYIFKMHDFEEKYIFKKHDFDEKLIFKKQILKEVLHTKNHILIHFIPWNAHTFRFGCFFEEHVFEEKIFPEKHDFECKFFLESMILNE